MTATDAIHALTRIATEFYRTRDGLRVQVRQESEIIRMIGREPDQINDQWTVAISGPCDQGVWIESHDSSLGQAVIRLYEHVVNIRRDSV